MKRQGSNELPRFAVGALAIAGASAANAATVQITFTGSYISTTGGNHIVSDYGGDGVANLVGKITYKMVGLEDGLSSFVGEAAGRSDLGVGNDDMYSASVWLRGAVPVGTNNWNNAAVVTHRGLVGIAFSDANIRSGALTNGWLDIAGYASEPGEKKLTVHRLIFDNNSATAPTGLSSSSTGIGEWSAVPEPSSLGLLALGAGGLLARRRRQAA